MAEKALKAKCLLCGSEFTKAGMTKHLQSCLPKDMRRFNKSADFWRGAWPEKIYGRGNQNLRKARKN